jgi:hypothetical protein
MLVSTAQHQSNTFYAHTMASEPDNMNRFLDEQLVELEQKFNLFMQEMEDDLIFTPLMVNEANAAWESEDFMKEPIAEGSKLITIDRHTTALCLTGSITVTVLVYLGMILSST